jgi:hypothetical protein
MQWNMSEKICNLGTVFLSIVSSDTEGIYQAWSHKNTCSTHGSVPNYGVGDTSLVVDTEM